MTIIVPTCAAYADILTPFVHFFEKFWPDCPYRKILINSPNDYRGFENFRTQSDLGWIANVLFLMETQGVSGNVLLLLDDYLLTQRISNEEIERADRFVQDDVGYIRLLPFSDNAYNSGLGWLWPSQLSYNQWYNLADLDRNSPKKLTRLPISLQPAIWNGEFVRRFFNPNWSPWQLEVLGSREYCAHGTLNGVPCNHLFLTTKQPVYSYVNGVRDGKYSREFVDLIKATPELQPFNFVRDVAIPFEKLAEQRRRELKSRQTDGSYPKARYA